MTRGTALHGRMKVAAATAVEACGTVEGAGATAGRGKSTAARWHNVNEPDLPTIDAACAMDKVATARGDMPPITRAMAAENGFVLVPEASARGQGDLTDHMCSVTSEAADVMRALAEANRAGLTDDRRAVALTQARELAEAASSLIALLEGGK